MIVVYGGEKVDIPVDQNDTINEVIQRAAVAVGQKTNDLKLIYKGKILQGTSILADIGNNNAKLLLVGNSPGNALVPDEISKLIRDDLTEEGRNHRRPYAINVRDIKQRTNMLSPYRFHKVVALSHYADAHRAHAILNSLATDPAILHVLELHKWSIGELCEMEPEGYVGVSEVCVLGLNQNKGQKIFLRIRTDDKLGFRKMLTIRNVLYHELAHNDHSDHDEAFFRLMRQVQREAEAADWTRSRAHRLSDSSVHETPTQVSNQTVHVLGGNASRSVLLDMYEVQQSCDVSLDKDEDDQSKRTENNSQKNVSHSAKVVSSEVGTTSSIDAIGNSQAHTGGPDDEEKAPLDLLRVVDTSLVHCLSGDSAPSSEYLFRLASALADVVDAVHQSVMDFMETCNLLRDIVVRAQDANYRHLKRRKKLYQRVIIARQAEPFLNTVGFDAALSGEELIYTRNDNVRLYLANALLDMILEAIKTECNNTT